MTWKNFLTDKELRQLLAVEKQRDRARDDYNKIRRMLKSRAESRMQVKKA